MNSSKREPSRTRARTSRTSKGTRTSTDAIPSSSSAGYKRRVGGAGRPGPEPPPVQVGDDAPGDAERLGLVAGQVVAQARRPGVHEGAAQLLLVGVLADGHLHERRPAQEDAGPVLDHDRVVAHAREVGAAGGGRAEHDADGRDPLGRELGQPAELLASGHEDVGLAGQVGPSGLDEDQHREAVLLGHVHGAQELADRRRARGPAAHRRVVRDDQALGVRHLGQRHDDAAAHRVAGVQTGQRAQLEHGRARVDQRLEPLAHHHLAAGPVALDVLRAPAGQHLVVQVRAPPRPARRMAARCSRELLARGGEVRPDGRAHGAVSQAGRRFSRNAAIPSAASARRRARPTSPPPTPSPSAHPWAGSVRSSALVARTAPGADLRDGRVRARPPRRRAPPRRRPTAESSPPAAASRRRTLAREGHGGEEAGGSTTRSAGTMIMAGATPTRTSLKANVLAAPRHGQVRGGDEAEAARPGMPVDPGDDRHRALDDGGEDVGHAAGRRRAALGEVGARAEHRARPGEHDGAHLGVARRVTQRPVQLARGGGRQRVAVGRRVERQGADAAARCCTPHQRIRHGAQCRGRPAEDGNGRWYRCAGDRDRRASAVPQDAPGPLRAGDRAPRRRVGGGPHLPGPRPLPQAGGRGPARARVRRGLRRHGRGPLLHADRRRGDGPHQLRRCADGHGGPDVDGDARAGPLRLATSSRSSIWRPPSAARS